MPRRVRFPYVSILTLKSGEKRYRAARRVRGEMRWGKLRATPAEASQDAVDLKPPEATSDLTVAAAFALAREELVTKRAPDTVTWFDQQKVALFRYVDQNALLRSWRAADVEQFIRARAKDVSASTVRHNLRALSLVFSLAIARGLLAANPLRGVKLPRVEEKAMDCFTPHELERIVTRIEKAGAEADADLVRLLFFSGIRRSEAARLTTTDVDMMGMILRIRGKTGRREVSIAPELEPVLRRMLLRVKDGASIAGGREHVAWVFRRWKAKLKEPRLHPHALRHACATALVRAGHDLSTIASMLGHRSLAMLSRYLHAHSKASRAAVASLSLRSTKAGGRKKAEA